MLPSVLLTMSHPALVEVTIYSLGSQAFAFRPCLPDLGRCSQALSTP